MKRYEKYKSSGVKWIGDIPSHWNCLRIKRLSNVKRGASPRPIDDPKYFDDNGEFSWVRIADVSASERYLETTTQTLSELGASLSVKRFPGDFFLSIAGTVGKPIITKIKCCIHDGFVWFPNLKTNPEYLYYIFTTGLPYQGLGKWGTQLNLNTDTVGEIFIPLPDDKEIESLVNYLDEKTIQIDKLISNKQKLIDLLMDERNSLINESVLKGRKKWKEKKLKYVAKVQSSGVNKKTEEGETPILLCNYMDVYKNEFIDDSISFMEATASEKEIEKFILREGDVLITKDSETPDDIANPAYVKQDFENVICAYHLAQIRPNKTELIGEYLFRLFQSKEFNVHFEVSANGVTRYGLPLDAITDVVIPLPPVAEQKEIAKHILVESKRIDETISKIEKEILLMNEYRTSLISEVVTGKIKVS